MSAPATRPKSKTTVVYQRILKVPEEIEMKMRSHVIGLKVSEVLTSKTVAKMLGGLALGAVLMAAAALPMGTAHADEPVSPLVAAAISAVGYADEFEDVEAGPGSARATFTTVVYVDQFGELEAGK